MHGIPTQDALTRGIPTRDAPLELARVGGVALSPDGEWVYYTERHLDWENNDSVRSTWLMPARGGTASSPSPLEKSSSSKTPVLEKRRSRAGPRAAPDVTPPP